MHKRSSKVASRRICLESNKLESTNANMIRIHFRSDILLVILILFSPVLASYPANVYASGMMPLKRPSALARIRWSRSRASVSVRKWQLRLFVLTHSFKVPATYSIHRRHYARVASMSARWANRASVARMSSVSTRTMASPVLIRRRRMPKQMMAAVSA